MSPRESVLVTGGAGFIGSWVLKALLERNARPIVYDLQPNEERWQRILGKGRQQVAFVPGDLADKDRLWKTCDDEGVSRLIHLGALLTPACQQDPWLGCQVNVLGSVSVFEYARQRADRIRGVSFASSLAVYGPEPDDASPSDRSLDDTNAPSFYGAYKRSVELIALQYWRHFGVRSFGLRPHVVYGPERTIGLTAGPSLAARAAVREEAYQINYTGPAGYDYVEDVAHAFVRGAWETPDGSVVVDLPSQPASIEAMIDILAELAPSSRGQITATGGPIPPNVAMHPHLITRVFPDWSPTSIRDGLRNTMEFYRG